MFFRRRIANRRDGFTTFELIIVLSVISTFSLFFYAKAFRPGLEAAKIRQISGVMENIADAVEQYALENNAAPATLADTGYVPRPHPFNGAYEFGADTVQGWVEAAAWLPAGRARVRGPANSLKNLNGTWDLATIRRPMNLEIWYDKKFLYDE